jgi:hypothetical protein
MLFVMRRCKTDLGHSENCPLAAIFGCRTVNDYIALGLVLAARCGAGAILKVLQ